MSRRLLFLLLVGASVFRAVIIDQIAVVVANSIVKDSDIDRDLRVTAFLNSDKLDLSEPARKATASRLIDQIFMRKEIELGDYPVATPEQADAQLEELVRERFKNDAALQNDLRRYGITAPDLRSHFLWQITALRFIDTRFKPAALVTDPDIERYYKEHGAALKRAHPGKSSLNDLRADITDILSGEQVNKLFFAWLDDQRKQSKIRFLERSLE